MFVPGEAFFAAAIESDPNLFEQAVRQHVLISTPTTLIALVKAIAYGWQQEKLAKNAQAVASLARDLFDRIKVFGGYMRDLGRSLQQAVERYNKGVGSLEVRVLPAARRFETLGVVPSGSEIPTLEPIEANARDVQA
jgi:DNA recombination protein RmuC